MVHLTNKPDNYSIPCTRSSNILLFLTVKVLFLAYHIKQLTRKCTGLSETANYGVSMTTITIADSLWRHNENCCYANMRSQGQAFVCWHLNLSVTCGTVVPRRWTCLSVILPYSTIHVGYIYIYMILQKTLKKLEQLERLRSEDTPRRLMITHIIESYWIPSQKNNRSRT